MIRRPLAFALRLTRERAQRPLESDQECAALLGLVFLEAAAENRRP